MEQARYFKLFLTLVSVLSVMLVGGCVSEKKETTTTMQVTTIPVTTTTSSTTTTLAETFEPLKLVYSMNNWGFGGNMSITFWLEDRKKCNGRDAYIGLMRMEGGGLGGGKVYAKITIYADNGKMAISNFANGENGLAFDDMSSQYNEFNIPLTLNALFAYAGENFNSKDYWNATTPVLLKNVESGTSIGNYSIIRQGDDTSGIIPCRKFKVIMKTTDTDGFFNACAVEKLGKINLHFMEYFTFENDWGPSWTLTQYSTEKSGISWYPQCLTPVKCSYVRQMPNSDRISCENKSGQVDSIKDEKGCVKEYKCYTQEQLVEQAIERTQRPGCPIDNNVKNKLLECRKNNKPNFTSTYDNSGCAIDVTCRE